MILVFLWGVQQVTALGLATLAGNPYNMATLQLYLIALPITAQTNVPVSNNLGQAETSVRRRNLLVPLLESIADQHTHTSAAQPRNPESGRPFSQGLSLAGGYLLLFAGCISPDR